MMAATPTSQNEMEQAIEKYTSSVTFMKQLTVIAVSTITYLKNVFPEDNYKVEKFVGLKIPILKNKCNDGLAQFLSKAIAQAFEAFNKKYLHQLVMCFYDGDRSLDNLLEYHIFEYSYKPGGSSISINSKGRDSESKSVTFTLDNVREKTKQLIKACVVVMEANNQPLPDNCDISVCLYYNEDAPEGYQAPGFVAGVSTEDPLGHASEGLVKLGRVETPFHRLVLRSYIKSTTASNESISSENTPVITQVPDDFHGSLRPEQKSVSDCSRRVWCVCNNYESDDPGALLVCMYCNRQQHATCYGVPAERAAAARHCCVACSDEDSTRTPTDAKLASVVPNKRKCFAIFRRSLELCARNKNISTSLLSHKLGLFLTSAAKLMKLFHRSGIIERHSQAGLETLSKIDHNQLKIVSYQYFQTGEKNIVDRLVAETFHFQNSQSNPVEDIVRPLKEVNLQNVSQFGRVTENPEATETRNPKDPTIKQYREALVLVKRDEKIEKTTDVVSDMDKLKKGATKKEEDTYGVEYSNRHVKEESNNC